MKWFWRLGALILILLAGPTQRLAAQDTTGVTFDFQDTDMRTVISALAQMAGLNITYGSLPPRTVTLRVSRPVPPADVRGILESMLRSNGLELVEDGDILRVATITVPPPGSVRPATRTATPEKRLFVYRLQHTRADLIVRTLRALFGLSPASGSPVSDTRDALSQQLRDMSRNPYITPAEPLAGAAAAPAGESRPGLALGLQAAVELVPESSTNSVMVLATPSDYEIIRGAVQAIDIRPLQVLIEVVIAEVRRDRTEDFGVSITVPRSPGSTDNQFTLTGLSVGDVAAKIVGIGDVGAEVVLRAISKVGNVTILSRPILLAKNNGEARILVGDQRPFIQISRVQPTDEASRDQVVQYRNVGTELTIRPTINADGYVSLAVTQEVSNATEVTQFGAPVINTREVQTELLIRDGRTAVLGGLMSRQRDRGRSGIPLLKDLPVLGVLFGTTTDHEFRNELLILLTPRIIASDEDMERISREFQQRGKELPAVLPRFLGDTVPSAAPSEP